MENTETPEKVETRKYELMIIFSPDIGEEGREKELEEIRKLVSEHNGNVFFEDLWDIRDLAHNIKKQEQGLYVVLNFETPESALIKELEGCLILNQEVLRHLLTKVGDGYSAKTASQYKEEAAEEAAEKEKEEAEKEKEKEKRAAKTPVKKEKVEKKEVKKVVEEKKEEKVEEEAPAEEAPVEEAPEEVKEERTDEEKAAEAKEKLDEVDKKLKSIIDDPDISL